MSNFHYQTIQLKLHERPVHVVKFNIEGDLLVTAADEGQLAVWDSYTGQKLFSSRYEPVAIRTVDFTPNSKFLAVGQNQRQFFILDWENNKRTDYQIDARGVRQLLFSKDGKRLFVITAKETHLESQKSFAKIYVYDSTDIQELKQISCHEIRYDTLSALLSADDEYMWLGTAEGSLVVLDVQNQFQIKLEENIDAEIHDLTLYKNGFVAVSCSDAKTVYFYSERMLEDVSQLPTQYRVTTCHMHPTLNVAVVGGGVDAQKVATCGNVDQTLITQFYDLEFKELVGEVKLHGGLIQSNRWSPDGLGMASGSWDGTVMLLRFDAGLLDYKFNLQW